MDKWMFLLLGAYLLGAIPVAYIVSKLNGVDLQSQGSKNLGATNVFRVMGPRWGVLVFALDFIKGAIPSYFALQFLDQPLWVLSVGFTAILAHSYSFFISFKGGKGVATGLGVLSVLCPEVFGIVFVLSVAVILVTKMVSVGSLLGAVLLPVLIYLFDYPIAYTGIFSMISVFIVWRHKANIVRLMKGEENQFKRDPKA